MLRIIAAFYNKTHFCVMNIAFCLTKALSQACTFEPNAILDTCSYRYVRVYVAITVVKEQYNLIMQMLYF